MTFKKLYLFIFSLVLSVSLLIPAFMMEAGISAEKTQLKSDHFDGIRYFNPGVSKALPDSSDQTPKSRGVTWWVFHWLFDNDWQEWPQVAEYSPGPSPENFVPRGMISITPIGHATFLIQIDGLNILTDPIWSERCSPVSWAGPKRHLKPGIRFEDLPPIDVVLVSHNHYDHLDLPTLRLLAKEGTPRAIVPLGNRNLVRRAGIPTVDELDWWQSVRVSPEITITVVPAQHFSMRFLSDYNQTLWGGFVISGYSGNVFYSGDTGYGPHFKEIAHRFSPIRVALLPIAPFRPRKPDDNTPAHRSIVHMGPTEAVEAHLDLGASFTIAGHFQTFRLGMEGFDDPATVLAAVLEEHNLMPETFVVPVIGKAINMPPLLHGIPSFTYAEKPIPFPLPQNVKIEKGVAQKINSVSVLPQ